jgi:hypothetical protein
MATMHPAVGILAGRPIGWRPWLLTHRSRPLRLLAGNTGWYFHFPSGAPKYQELWLSQVPMGTHIIYASRFPAGTQVGRKPPLSRLAFRHGRQLPVGLQGHGLPLGQALHLVLPAVPAV